MMWVLLVLVGLPLFYTITNFWGRLLRKAVAGAFRAGRGNPRAGRRITIEATTGGMPVSATTGGDKR